MDENLYASRRTPIDHTYPSCDRTCASLLIYPNVLCHEDITQILNLEPTDFQNKGDRFDTPSGRIRIAKLTMWELSSEPYVTSKDLRTHIDWVLEQLSDSADSLRYLQNEGHTRMAMACVWWSCVGHGGPALWPEQMKAMADLNLECSFEIQFYPEEGEGYSTF